MASPPQHPLHCRQARVPKHSVTAYLRQAYVENGLEPPAVWRGKIRDPEAVANLYRQPGATKQELTNRLGITATTLNKILQQAGIGNLCRRCKRQEVPKGSSNPCPQCAQEQNEKPEPDNQSMPAAKA